MSSYYFAQSLLLTFSIIFSWLWTRTPGLNDYNLQLTGALTLAYFGFRFFYRPSDQKVASYPATIILNTICLVLIFSTGGLNSPLFFLLALLLFALSLLFSPSQGLLASILIVAIFIFNNYQNLDTTKIVNITSLVLMTPLAVIFSRTYLDALESQGKITLLEKTIQETEVDSLLWISTSAKPSLANVLNATTDLVMYFNSRGKELAIPKGITDKLFTIQKDMIALYTSANTLEKSIQASSDKMEDK